MKQGTETIRERKLKPEQYLAIHLSPEYGSKTVSNDNVRNKDSEMWFFQVADIARLSYDGITLRDSDGNKAGPIQPDQGVAYNQLYDTEGNDILRNEDNSWRVYHFGLGVKQDRGMVYPRIPENQNGGAWSYMSGSEPDPTNGPNYGQVEAADLDYEVPNNVIESMAWREGSRSSIQFGFFNNSNRPIDPLMSVRGYAYELRPVSDRDDMVRLLSDMSKPKSKRGSNIEVRRYTENVLRSYSYTTPSSWEDAENNLKVSHHNLPVDIDRNLREKIKDKVDSAMNGGN